MNTHMLKEKLKERIKELECLYEVSTLLNEHEGTIETRLELVGKSVKKAWRYPDAAIVTLQLDDHQLVTGIVPSNTIFQEAKFKVFGKVRGYMRVHYPTPDFGEEHFLNEESVLLEEVAYNISKLYEKYLNAEREAVVKQNAELVDRLSILAEITAGIAHELNTPLGNILGFAELLSEKQLDGQSEQDVRMIRSAAIYSREIVKKLMFFSCEMPHSMELIEIKPVITQVLSFLEHKFNKQSVFYQLTLTDDTLKAQVDPVQFTQILFNLLLNALYVSPKESTMRIAVDQDATSFYIEIADCGQGVPNEIKTKVFEPFFTTKPLGDGTGLGLSVVHGIVKGHRGEITIADNKPQGAIFAIVLPLYQDV